MKSISGGVTEGAGKATIFPKLPEPAATLRN
jgi:hypothetical protein